MNDLKVIIDLLVCPECRNQELVILNNKTKGSIEIIKCQNCGIIYMFENGILNFLNTAICDYERETKLLSFIDDEHKDEINNKKTKIENKIVNASSDENKWKEYEKEFWDNKKYDPKNFKVPEYTYNRNEPRKKHLIEYFKKGIENKVVVEFGSGNSSTLFHLLNPDKYNYKLINTDISYNALLNAKLLHPNQYFIQCDACEPPFRENSIDIVINFGTLHHLPDNITVLKNQINCLKKGGILAFHEPLDRRKPFLGKESKLKSILYDYEESDHNEFIFEKETLEILKDEGEILNLHYEYSPIRPFLVSILIDRLKINNKYIFDLINLIDQFTIKTIGRLLNIFDANSLLLVWKKKV